MLESVGISNRPIFDAQQKNTHIIFTNKSKRKRVNKNFTVLHQGVPLTNKYFDIIINRKGYTIPLFHTDKNGQMEILVRPVFNPDMSCSKIQSIYRPLKFSDRLKFVVKDYKMHMHSRNPLYRSQMLGRYLDLGISEHFLRTLIKKTDFGESPVDGTDSFVIQNWIKATLASKEVQDEYRAFNIHTEKTTKCARKLDRVSYGLIGAGGLGVITLASLATAGIIDVVAVAIAGVVVGAGSFSSFENKYFKSQPADISRPRDTVLTADNSLKIKTSEDDNSSEVSEFKSSKQSKD